MILGNSISLEPYVDKITLKIQNYVAAGRIVNMEEIFEVSFADNNEEEEGEGNQEKYGNAKNCSRLEIICI